MRSNLFLIAATLIIVALACANNDGKSEKSSPCACDTLQTLSIVNSSEFNALPAYDSAAFSRFDFYKLDSAVNRILWYRDVENPDTTKFTRLWNDYFPAAYHASQLDFVRYYKGKTDVELAFQLGPNRDLWAYHIFVVKQVQGCYLVTRSYFRHARFTYKAYAITTTKQFDSLHSILDSIITFPVVDKEEFSYRGYFVNNRDSKMFYVDLEKDTSVPVKRFYDFIDNRLPWRVTYTL